MYSTYLILYDNLSSFIFYVHYSFQESKKAVKQFAGIQWYDIALWTFQTELELPIELSEKQDDIM